MALNGDYEVNPKLLELVRNGEKGGRLVAVIDSASANASDPILVKLIIDLRALVTFLDECKKDAVQRILGMDWSKKSEEIVREHSQLLISLATAHACHLESVLKFFVKQFLSSSLTGDSLEEHDAKTLEGSQKLWNEAHKALALILEILPTSSRCLIKLLRENYPFMKRHVVHLRDYVRNLLVITSYAPNMRTDILRIIVDELMKLDTTCSQEALEAAINVSTASSSDMEIFPMEADVPNSQKSDVKAILDLRTKLDSCMYHIFKYLSSLRGEAEEKLFSFFTDLLTIFESSVLPVYSSHHVQFLWFVFCSYDKKIWKHFLRWLWLHVQTPSIVSVVRQNAASYLASYLARAVYLDVDVVTTYVKAWTTWIHAYIGNQEGASGNENAASVHSTFYSLCQAVFYVVAFRVKDILALRNGHDFLKSLNLDRVVTCRLNPLKYCSEKVVINFANVSRNYQFAFCYTILERNRRSSFFDMRRNGIAPNQLLECFFPFDPFLLPKSIEFVTPVYREYEEGHLETDTVNMAVTSRNNEQDDVDDFLDGELMEMSPRRTDGSFEMMSPSARELMFSYSVSPGFKHG